VSAGVAPLVRAVVVNYNGGDLTRRCLESLEATRWPRDRLELVLIDNASSDGVPTAVERDLPDVIVIRSPRNLGFAGGSNLGMSELGAVDFVALVNNDATVDPDWLAPLVEALEHDDTLGAACPKILFSGLWVDVEVTCPTRRHGWGDRRDLGVRVEGARVDGVDVWPRVQRVRGFWGDDPDAEWTNGSALLRVPTAEAGAAEAELLLASDREVAVVLRSGPSQATVTVGRNAEWQRIPLGAPRQRVVNNTGTELRAEGYGADRSYLLPDDGDGDDDQPDDVFAWCGAGVLLRRAYLETAGLFDERLFLYYEDLELSWRGRERGWRYRYVPQSVMHHVHAATTGEGSALKDHYTARNRLLVMTRHARTTSTVHALARYALVTGSYAVRDLVSPVLRGRRPNGTHVARRLRAFGAYFVRAPGMLRSRHRDRAAERRA
jgi:GT2 family glycosyltransferase